MLVDCGLKDKRTCGILAGRIGIIALMAVLFIAGPVLAQPAPPASATPQHTANSSATPFAFAVASIKPSDPNARYGGGGFLATGLHIVNYPLAGIVMMAYFQNGRGNQAINMPAWTLKESYSIDAHIDEASAPAWLKLNPRQWQIAGRPMLQELLADRCKLVAHLVPAQVSGYALVVHKRGSGLEPAQPRDSYPEGVKNLDPEGGKILTIKQSNSTTMIFFNALLPDLATLIGGMSGSVVADRTNLTGRYNFTVHRLNPVDADGKRINDPSPADIWDLSGTGLEIRAAKLASENLVIDHIERPSPN